MPRIRNVVALICFAVPGSMALAQILSPLEIRDLQMRELQQKHLTDLKAVTAAISAHSFPYRLYFSRTMDLNEEQQQRMDQRSIRFEKFHTQTVLQITANYYASYSGELMSQEERARRTMQDVMIPILRAAIPVLAAEEKLQAFALEISHHVRKKVLGVSAEHAENVAFILPRAAALRLVAAQTREEQEAVLMLGTLFVDGNPLAGWGQGEANVNAEKDKQEAPGRVDAKPAPRAIPLASTIPLLPGEHQDSSRQVAGDATPPARLAAEPRAEVSADGLRKLQSSNQVILDRMVHDLDKQAHFVSYAPPTFVAFHKGAYLQISLTSSLLEKEGGSQYRVAALAFDEHVAHLIRPVLAALKPRPDFDGIDFSTSVRLAGAAGSVESVEFIFPDAALSCYEAYDCTGQQLVNQGFALINGERVSLDLQSAEAGSTTER